MDQAPIPYHSNKTLDVKGTTTVQARASTTDTTHITLAATVATSGKLLPPFLIFKGKLNGRIAMWEFSTYPTAGKYAYQEKALRDADKIHKWIDVVFKP